MNTENLFDGTIEETFEYRVSWIVKKVIKNCGGEIKDFKTEDELLDYLYSDDIAEVLGKYLVDDMTEWTDEWLDIVKGAR